jgi:alkanesulfonate monooxygenase SsuD/methylene tetrahydromethanopterin reductase-like flavin-dependent oxidoreductase (luciferase family)
LQQPHPPIYIPGAGSTETMKFVAEHHYTYMSVYAPSSLVRQWFDGYRRAARAVGYAPVPEKLALSIPIYVAESDEQAHREGRPQVEWLFHRGLKQRPEIVFPPGYMSQSSMRAMLMSGMKPYPELTYEELIADGYAVVGCPDAVIGRLRELHDELGFGQVIGLFALGGLSHRQVMGSMELFAAKVMPALRPLGAVHA